MIFSRPGDVIVESVKLKSLAGPTEFDISGQLIAIDIYESVCQPVIMADVEIQDNIGLRQSFPLLGEEMLTIAFSTPGGKTLTYSMMVYLVANVQPDANQRGESYTLHAVSYEGMKNASVMVTQRFNDSIDNIIGSLFRQLEPTKPVLIDPTVGIDQHTIVKLTPLQAIDKFRRRAVSPSEKSSSFVFFESTDAFVFTTLEKLLQQARNKDVVADFYWDDNANIDTRLSASSSVLALERSRATNTMDRIREGGLKTTVQQFDLIRNVVTEVTTDEVEFDSMDQAERSNSVEFKKKFGSTTARNIFVPLDVDEMAGGVAVTTKIGPLSSFVQKINQNSVNILINGNSSLAITQPIKLTIADNHGLTDRGYTESTYIISKLRHRILFSAQPKHIMSLELVNNSLDI